MQNYEKALAGELLAGVSRSFYTTLKLLPGSTRGTIGLMYLLARTADTLADTEQVDPETRLECLARFGRLVEAGGDVAEFAADVRERFCPAQAHEKEKELLQRVDESLAWLGVISEARADCIRKVLKTIIRGQTLDLERFGGAGRSALAAADDLDDYTYLVAGSVGEFWTEVGFLELGDRYAVRGKDDMLELGRRYGQGLQLINILRDLPDDLAAGRCYLPLDELGVVDAPPEKLLEVAATWRRRCREHFDCGADYVAAVKNRRMRLAAALPLLIGAKALPLLDGADWARLSEGVKVSRKEVRMVMLRALVANLTRGGMAKHCVRALERSASV